jgi:hypothetical protein
VNTAFCPCGVRSPGVCQVSATQLWIMSHDVHLSPAASNSPIVAMPSSAGHVTERGPAAADGCALGRQDRRVMSSHLRNPVRVAIFAVLHGFPVETGAVNQILTDTHVSGFPPGRSADRHERGERGRRTVYLPSLPRPWPAGQATGRHRRARYLRCTWHRPHVDLPCDRAQTSAAITQPSAPPAAARPPHRRPFLAADRAPGHPWRPIYAYERAA